MNCYIANAAGVIIDVVQRPLPGCGEVYCDTCGDCLHCYASDPCIDGGEHLWVLYMDDDETENPRTGSEN